MHSDYLLPTSSSAFARLALADQRRATLRGGGGALLVTAMLWLWLVPLPSLLYLIGYIGAGALMGVGYFLSWRSRVMTGATLLLLGYTYAAILLLPTARLDCVIATLVTAGAFILACDAPFLRVALAVGLTLGGFTLWHWPPPIIPSRLAPTALVLFWFSTGIGLGGIGWCYARQVAYLRTRLGMAQHEIVQQQTLEATKDLFVASINHELRTPFMALIGYIDILKHRWPTMPDDRRSTILTDCERVGRKIRHLLDQILKVREVQGLADYQPVPVNVRAACHAAIAEVRAAMTDEIAPSALGDRAISLRVPDLIIQGDGTYLQQILANLLTNAVKYSPSGTPIDIAAEAKAGQAIIQVRDYGLGIPPGQQHIVFERFTRLHRDIASAERKGTGLGLWLCREYTEAMHGTITVASRGIEGDGTTFTVTLPLATPETEGAKRNARHDAHTDAG